MLDLPFYSIDTKFMKIFCLQLIALNMNELLVKFLNRRKIKKERRRKKDRKNF